MPRDTKSADWNAIRAEYIAGGISTRKLADKYGVNASALMARANREKWAADRKDVASKAQAKSKQKIACMVSDRAAEIAAKKEQFAADLMDAAQETLAFYRRKGGLSAQNLKFLSGFLKDMTSKDAPVEDKSENGTLAAALTEAVKSSEVWNGEAQDVPV